MARYALIIGISQYQSPQMSRLPKAASDAEILAQVLEEYGGFSVKRLPERWNGEKNCFEISPEKTVTASQVGQELRTLLLERAPKNEALIYFAGHGFTFSDSLGQQKGVLATSDCQVEMVGNQVIDYKSGISLASLNELIQQSDLSSLVMLLDCCHSGYFLESQLIQRTLTAFSTQKDYYLIAACRTFETAKSFKGEPHSYFTGAVLNGLNSTNTNRNHQVSGDRLFDYISGELKGFVQEPIRMGWGRSITLVTYPQLETKVTEITFDRQNPYQGLNAFDSEQKRYFFGRDLAIRELITHLTNSRFVPIIGYSGSGKSSLVKAGLLPELKSDRIPGSSQWLIESFTPGKYPLGKLTDILARQRDKNHPYVIFIDQFEELFTLCENETERRGFIHLISEEMNQNQQQSRIIIAIRGDFLTRCADYPEIGNLINRHPPIIYLVMPLLLKELEEAIEKPAELHGVKFERGLVLQISQDIVGQPGALPLLQYALKELWRVCIEVPEFPEPILTKQAYEEIGGVHGALENRANIIYESFNEVDRNFVRLLFLELVHLEGQNVMRRRVHWKKLRGIANSPEQLQRVVDILAGSQQRLIITDQETVEVAHEALLSKWTLLSNWIEENREVIRISRRFELACKEWQETYNKSNEALLTGVRLAEVEDWEKNAQPKLNEDEREFFQKSLQRRDQLIQDEINKLEKEIKLTDEKLKAQKQRTKLAITSGILLSLTIGLGLFSNLLAGQKREQEASKIGVLIGKAQQLFDSDLQLEALIASVDALKEMKKQGREDPRELKKIQSIVFNVRERNRLKDHQEKVNGVNFSPDGTMIVSGGEDQKIIIWDQSGKKLFSPNEGHNDSIWNVRFSPNSQLIASTSLDDTIKIWNRKGQLIKTLKGHQGDVYDVSFSKNSQRIYSSSEDGTIRTWKVETGSSPSTFKTPNSLNKSKYFILGLDLEPQNNSVLAYTGNRDYEFSLWDMNNQSNQKPKDIGTTQSLAMSVRFNQKGNMIVSCDNRGTIKIWDRAGNLIGLINSPKDTILLYAEFSDDSKYIAAASVDKTIKIWRVNEVLNEWKSHQRAISKPFDILRGHTNTISRLSFNPLNSQLIASASEDGTVRIWEIFDNEIEVNKIYKLDELQTKACNFLSNYSQVCQNSN